jgi:hypothetical protein
VARGRGYSRAEVVQEEEFVEVAEWSEVEEVVVEVAYKGDCSTRVFCEDIVDYCLEAVDCGV